MEYVYSKKLASIFEPEYIKQAISSRSRKDRVCIARHCLRYLLSKHFTSVAIGRHYGNDHSTILHSMYYVNSILKYNDRKLYDAVQAMYGS